MPFFLFWKGVGDGTVDDTDPGGRTVKDVGL
jgi:hypothetical protein